jgi:hypothetical protein
LNIGKHLWVGAELAFGKHVETVFTAALAPDCVGHLHHRACGWTVRRLVEAEAVVEAGGFLSIH